MPLVQSTTKVKIKIVINVVTAKALGLDIP